MINYEVIDSIRAGCVLYVVSQDGRSVKATEVLKVITHCDREKDPEGYKSFVTRYISGTTNGTVTFYPNDFEKIIFADARSAHKKRKEKKMKSE